MNNSNINPPQPIPYPDNALVKKLYRLPILLYRLGLGFLIGKYILILSTTGRKTGKIHRTPVEYYQCEGRIFVMSGFGERPDWYKNLQANPQAGLNIKGQRLCVKARKPQKAAEWDGVFAFLKASPVSHFSEPARVNELYDLGIRGAIKKWPVMTFDPINESCPAPLEADLAWAWPLILLSGALLILKKWLYHRKRPRQIN